MARLAYEAHFVPDDGGHRTVWCASPTRDDVFRFMTNLSPQLASGRLELAQVESSHPPLPPFAKTPEGAWVRYAMLGTNLPPW